VPEIILPDGTPVAGRETCAGFTVRIPSLNATQHLGCSKPAAFVRITECCGTRRTALCWEHAAVGKRSPARCIVCGRRVTPEWERV
jgi:hypothetical protein